MKTPKTTHRFGAIRLFPAFILIFLLTACDAIRSPTSSATTNPLSSSELQEIVEQEMALQNILGVAVGVVEDGQITHVESFGYLDEARTEPVTNSTVFRYASVSKSVTAIALFKAITQGHLGLNDPVIDHVPYWPAGDGREDITIAHLLSHRSGINDYGKIRGTDIVVCNVGNQTSNASNSFDAERSVNRFNHCDLVFPPGTEHAYTTYGYDLLGAAIEEASGMDYVAYVNTHIKNVANMTSLSSSAPSPGGFDYDCNLRRISKSSADTPIKVPGGGWSSNIQDFTKLLQGIINNDFLPTSLVMWQPVTFPNDNREYIYGFRRKSINGTDYVHHTGSHPDLKAYLGLMPGDRNGVCVFMNGNNAASTRIGEKVLAAMGYNFSRSSLPYYENGGNIECGDQVVSVWRQTGNARETILRRELNNSNFLHEIEALADLGWTLIDIETEKYGTVRRWDGIFKKDAPTSYFFHDYSTGNFGDLWQQENNAGRRLIDIEVYKNGTQTRWAGVFQEGQSSNYALWRGFNTEDFGDKYAEMSAAGKKMIDVETYKVGANWKWAGVWLGTGNSPLNRNYDRDDFIDLCQDRIASGYRLVDVETYEKGNTQRYAGIWEPSDQNENRWFNIGLGRWLNEKHNTYQESNYELIDLEKY